MVVGNIWLSHADWVFRVPSCDSIALCASSWVWRAASLVVQAATWVFRLFTSLVRLAIRDGVGLHLDLGRDLGCDRRQEGLGPLRVGGECGLERRRVEGEGSIFVDVEPMLAGETPPGSCAIVLNSCVAAARVEPSPVKGPPEVVTLPDASVVEVIALFFAIDCSTVFTEPMR